MPAFIANTTSGKRWRFRKVITLPNGTKTRITGTPDINSKAAALEAEREAIVRVTVEGPRVGRPLEGDEARTINLTVRVSETEAAEWAQLAAHHNCTSIADGVRLAMSLLKRARRAKAGR